MKKRIEFSLMPVGKGLQSGERRSLAPPLVGFLFRLTKSAIFFHIRPPPSESRPNLRDFLCTPLPLDNWLYQKSRNDFVSVFNFMLPKVQLFAKLHLSIMVYLQVFVHFSLWSILEDKVDTILVVEVTEQSTNKEN